MDLRASLGVGKMSYEVRQVTLPSTVDNAKSTLLSGNLVKFLTLHAVHDPYAKPFPIERPDKTLINVQIDRA